MSLFYVQWHITNFCNLRCRHCYQEDFSREADLPLAGLVRVAGNFLDAVARWGRRACIHLTGGEPLLQPDLFPLLKHLDRHPAVAELGIITNGLLLDSSAAEKLSSFPKLRKLKISLDGPEAETNDPIRAPGAFQRARQGLSSLPRNGRFEKILMFTVMKRNASRLFSFLQFAKKEGADGVILERFIPWGRGRGLEEGVLSPAEWRQFVESLYNFFGLELEENEVSPYQAFRIEFRGAEAELMGAPCVLGTDGLCVMPDGTVFPCRRFPLSIGNLCTDSLKEIWKKSEVLKKVRRKENLKGRCGTCRIEGCTGCRSLAYALTGDYLAEDPHCEEWGQA
jgi:radical SAM protein with 4Fe4S-binding SPASM domain